MGFWLGEMIEWVWYMSQRCEDLFCLNLKTPCKSQMQSYLSVCNLCVTMAMMEVERGESLET